MLAQKPNFQEGSTTKESVLQALTTLNQAKQSLEQIAKSLQNAPYDKELLKNTQNYQTSLNTIMLGT